MKAEKNRVMQYLCLALSVVIITAVLLLPVGVLQGHADDENGSVKQTSSLPSPGTTDPKEILENIKELEESLKNIADSKTELQSKLDEVLANKDEIESKYLIEKIEADAEIQLIDLRIDVYNDIISKYDVLIGEKQAEIDEINERFNEIYDIFSERLRQSHEEGLPSTLEIFFNSESFIEVLTSIERMNDISEHDKQVMAELEVIEQEKKDEMEALNGYLSDQKAVVESLEAVKTERGAKLQESLDAIDLENKNIDEYIHLLQIADQDEELMNEQLQKAITDYYNNIDKSEQKEYQKTEEYKRAIVQPAIIKEMEEGNIMKGSEYFDDGFKYIWPLSMTFYEPNHITSRFGMRTYVNLSGVQVTSNHKGYDLAVPRGNNIYACRSGTVVAATYNASYGYYVDLLHDDGSVTRYAHSCKLLVTKGEYVLQGETIALVGTTGNSTGYHVHVEVRLNDVPQNPSNFIPMPKRK